MAIKGHIGQWEGKNGCRSSGREHRDGTIPAEPDDREWKITTMVTYWERPNHEKLVLAAKYCNMLQPPWTIEIQEMNTICKLNKVTNRQENKFKSYS